LERDAVLGNDEEELLVADRVGDSAVLDRVIHRLHQIERSSGIEKTFAIGRLLLTQFFGSDPAIWRDRRRNKNNSIRRLAGRADCPLSKSALNDAVAVYVASRELDCVQTTGHITASHISVVLSLPPTEREDMLRSAENGRWSVRQLKTKVVASRRADGERRGRPAQSDPDKALGIMANALQRFRQALATLRQDSLTPAAHLTYEELTSETLALAAELEARLGPKKLSVMRLRAASPGWPAEGEVAEVG
jgi:hypothetical protein